MPKHIPHIDLWPANRPLEKAFFASLKAWYRKGAFSGGEYVEGFERDFAAYLGRGRCVAVNSGTSAIHLALLALGVGPGDEVIVPAYTFAGSVWGVLYCGARPVFADVSPGDGNLDPAGVARAVTGRTKAVIAVHLFGRPADLPALREVADGKRIFLVEDAAQAHGGSLAGRALGTVGDMGCFSFYPTKNLGTCGEGGAVITRSAKRAEAVRRLRNHNCVRRYEHLGVGYNYRMEGIQGLFLSAKLRALDGMNAERARVAAAYLGALEGTSVVPLSRDGESVWHAFVCKVARRAAFLRHLDAAGIGHAVYYPKILPELPVFRAFAGSPRRFPGALELSRSSVSLPLYPGLARGDVRRVAAALRAWR